jgi:translocation and assembly module TamB
VKRASRIVRRVLLGVGALLVLIALFAAFVVFTPPGAKLALWVAKQRDLPVSVESIGGTLAGRLVLRNVSFAIGPAHAVVDTLIVDWSPAALRQRRVQINEAIVAGGRVRIEPEADDTTRVADTTDAGVRADSDSTARWTFHAERLRVRGVSVDSPDHDVHLRDVDVRGSGGPDGYRAEVRASGSVPRFNDVSAFVDASGDMRAATMDTFHVRALGGRVNGNGFLRWKPSLSWRGRVSGDSLSVTELLPSMKDAPGPASLRASSTGLIGGDSMRVHIDVDTLDSEYRNRPLSVSGLVDLDGNNISASDARIRWGTSHATVSGSRKDGMVNATVDATIPVLAEIMPQASGSASVRAMVGGSPDRWNADLDVTGRNARLNATEVTEFTASVEATAIADGYVPHGAEIRRAWIRSAGAAVDARGTVAWKNGITWDGVVAADSVELSRVTPSRWNLRGPLSLRVSTEGSKHGERVRASADIDSLYGMVREQDIGGSGIVAIDGEQIDVSSLRVQWGETRIRADGRAGGELGLEFDVVAPDLAAIDPSMRGAVSLEGSVRGSRKTPHVNVEIDADSVRTRGYAAGSVEGHIDVDLGFESPADVQLEALKLEWGGTAVDTLTLAVSGPRDAQRAGLSLVAGASRASLALQGAFADTTWSGWVEDLRIKHARMPGMELRGRAPLSVSRTRASIDSLELVSGESSLKAHGVWERGGRAAAGVELEDFDLAVLEPFLTEGATITGKANGSASLSIDARGGVNANVDLTPGPGELVYGNRKIAYEGSIKGHADSTGVFAELSLDLKQGGAEVATVDGELAVPGLELGRDEPGKHPVEGQIDLNCTDIAAVLTMFVPALTDNASGKLTAQLSPVGTAADFRIKGRVVLEDGRADLRNGVLLRDTDITVTSDDDGKLSLNGAVTSGGGRIELEASSTRSKEGMIQGAFTARGERFLLVNQPEAKVYISPDLDVQVSERVANLTGKIVVPYARIETAEVPESAVKASDDVIVVEDTLTTKRAWDVRTDVRVELGDSVTFSGYGLQGRLVGDLAIRDERGQPTRGRGEIQIENGKYRAYGNELKIDQGRLVFGGGPIDNPGLDIRATRNLTSHSGIAGSGEIVGMNLRGTLRDPEVSLFSSPPMSDSEIMSYLVLGRPMDSGEDQSALASAALMVGMQKGSGIAGGIGEKFALDEAYIEGGDDVNETAFVAGKYISPKMYVAYVAGLFEKTNTFRVRYSLDRKWTLQAESGDESSTDILYWFERGKK